MQRTIPHVWLLSFGAVILLASWIALATTQTAYAQCGSQASSCKNCHEVQGQGSVNSDGTGWHGSHAFGDFCYICHAGNNQATEKEAAHTGMAAPLSDVEAACQQCHPNDLQDRAQVYAASLGVELGAPAPTTVEAAPEAAAVDPAPAESEPPVVQLAGVLPGDPNLVDYVERYNQEVLGEQPVNWGNVILLALIAAMTLGGGYLVVSREGLVRVSFKETRPLTGEYPPDVVEMVPDIARLNPAARQSLRRLLGKPAAVAEILTSIDKLANDSRPESQD